MDELIISQTKIKLFISLNPSNAVLRRGGWIKTTKFKMQILLSGFYPLTGTNWPFHYPFSNSLDRYDERGLSSSCVVLLIEVKDRVRVDPGLPCFIRVFKTVVETLGRGSEH